MSDDERDRLVYDLVVVLLPRLTDAQVKRLHASAAAMCVRTADKGSE